MRADFDGENFAQVSPWFQSIPSVAVEPVLGILFWTQEDGIYRTDLDGQGAHRIVTIEGRITDMAIWTAPGDFDRDGDVDLADLMTLQSCVTDLGEPLADDPACHEADLDFDRDVDLADLVAFQAHFTGAR